VRTARSCHAARRLGGVAAHGYDRLVVDAWFEGREDDRLSVPEADQVAPVRLSVLLQVADERLRELGVVLVEGDVLRPKRWGRGWWFLELGDEDVRLSVSVPPSVRLGFELVEGARVAIRGRLGVHVRQGQLRLTADWVGPAGLSEVEAMIAEVRRRLQADGILDRPRRPLPRLPRTIGVVCGHEAAVRADIRSVADSRFPGYPLRFVETTVSGPDAPARVGAALAELLADPLVDVVVIARGGGSPTDLLVPFSDEGLLRAVAAAPVPVVSAIGHDGDRPLLDEVADVRAGTPSIAAALVVPERRALLAELDDLGRRLAEALGQTVQREVETLARLDPGALVLRRLDGASRRLEVLDARLAGQSPQRRLLDARARLARLDLQGSERARLASARQRLDGLGATLAALSPSAVLARGYAIVRSASGGVLRRAADVGEGEEIVAELADGSLRAQVLQTLRR